MRKLIVCFLSVILIMGVASCSSNKDSSTTEPVSVTSDESGPKITMIGVVGRNHQEAVKALEEAGFTSISSNTQEDTSWPEVKWIVTEQSVPAGSEISKDAPIELICKKELDLYLELTSDFNLLFSTYDMELYLDGEEIGTVANNSTFTKLLTVLSGEHELKAVKAGDTSPSGTKTLNLNGSITFKANISHTSSSIEFKDMETIDGVEGSELEVTNVVGKSLDVASQELKDIGFKNVKSASKDGSTIILDSNWIVTEQSVAAGKVVDKNTEITLSCVKAEDFYDEVFKGKTVLEADAAAEKYGIEIHYTDKGFYVTESEYIDVPNDEKAYWFVERVSRGLDAGVVLCIKYDGPEPETESVTVTEEETTIEPTTESIVESTEEKSSESSEEPKKYTNHEVRQFINTVLGTTFSSSEYKVLMEESPMVNIQFRPEGITLMAYRASELKDKSALSAWNNLVSAAKKWSIDLKEYVSKDMNRPDLGVVLYYCHDINTENVLLVAMNGRIYYDLVNGIDLMSQMTN